MKRMLPWILTLSMLLVMLTTGVFAEESTVTASGMCGENLIWELTSDGLLTISGEGKMEDYDEEELFAPWYELGLSITGLVVGDDVETIGTYAFLDCEKLVAVDLGAGITAIGEGAFDNCSFSAVTIPASIKYLANGLFMHCAKLASIQVAEDNPYFCSREDVLFTKDLQTLLAYPREKTDSSYSVPGSDIADHAFYANAHLQEVTVADGTLSIGNNFCSCSGLTAISLPRSLQRVNDDAFAKSGLEKVTYDGTDSMWKLLNIDEENLLMTVESYEFLPDNGVDPLWDALHQMLNLKGNTGDAQYALVAVYDENGRMVRAEVCTKEQMESDEGFTLEGEDLEDTSAKIMYVQDEQFVPAYEEETPAGDKDYSSNGIYEGWLYAVDSGFIDRWNDSVHARDGKLLFCDGESTLTASAEDCELSKADLGCAFRIQYVADSGDILSVERLHTCIFQTAEVREMESSVSYNTSSNQASKKYLFNIGELEGATFDAASIPVLTMTEGLEVPGQMAAAAFHRLISDGAGNVDRYTVVDRDGDGDIDYLLYTPVGYGQITKLGTSKKYGDFMYITNGLGDPVKSLNSGAKLYLDESIYTEDELDEDDIVRYYWDASLEKLVVEQLPKIYDAEYTKYKANQGQYTLDGVDYTLADNGFTQVKEVLNGTKGLGWAYDIVADGDLLVWAARWENEEEIAEHLAVLMQAETQVYGNETVNSVKLLYSRGETEWMPYDDASAAEKNTDDTDAILVWEELTQMEQLVIFHSTEEGVWLEALPAGAPLSIDPMQEFVDEVQRLEGTLTVEGGEADLNGAAFAADTQLFASIDNEYQVITAEELSNGTFEKVEMTALTRTGKRYDTIVGGFLKLDTTQYVPANDYLFVLEAPQETTHGSYATVRMNFQEKKMEILLDPSGVTEPEEKGFYAYETTLSGSYILSELTETAAGELSYDADGNLYYDDNGVQTLLDVTAYDVIGLRETTLNSKQNTMVTSYDFCDPEEIMDFVMDYEDTFLYTFAVCRNPDSDQAVLVVDMEEKVELLDAAAIYADGDTIDLDAVDAVELLYALDIMLGDGTNFNPEATVTRAEMAKMVYVMLNYGEDDRAKNDTGANIFTDVESGAWYEGYVNYCATTALTQGKGDGTFGPTEPISCAEAAKFLLLAIGYDGETRGYLPSDENWDKNVLADAATVGLLDDYKYNVNASVQRQWLAKLIENALTKVYIYESTESDSDLLFGEKYYDLTKGNYVWKSVYGQ